MIQLALVFIIGVVTFVVMRIALRRARLSLQTFFSLYLLALVGFMMVFLGLTGRLHWLFAIIGSILPFTGSIIRWGLRLWSTASFLKGIRGTFQQFQYGGGQKKSSGQTSEVESAALRMVLDHDTGHMNGEVLIGQYAGKRLADLGLNELLDLYHSLANDEESSKLLEAYLDREHPDWDRDTDRGKADGADSGRQTRSQSDGMTPHEAREILGVESSATPEEIKQAHKRMIQKLHPDRGGSTYLAARVNEAKDLLLRHHG